MSEKIQDKIKELEDRLARTQIHKGTQKAINYTKAQIAKLRNQLVEIASSKGGGGRAAQAPIAALRTAWAVVRDGDVRPCGLVGGRPHGCRHLRGGLDRRRPARPLELDPDAAGSRAGGGGAQRLVLDSTGAQRNQSGKGKPP